MKPHATFIAPAQRNPGRPARSGSVIIMVLFILVIAVMLASTFMSMMTTYRASGTRMTARQLASQASLAGVEYAQFVLRSDYAAARSAGKPQRYNKVAVAGSRTFPLAGEGPLPAGADRVGVDWSLIFQGRIETIGDADGTHTTGWWAAQNYETEISDNQYLIHSGGWWDARYADTAIVIGTDNTRRPKVDSMRNSQDVALQYYGWENGWFVDSLGKNLKVTPETYISPFVGRHLARPRWWTSGYYDQNFQPLDWADRDAAVYETRFSVQPIPLDGCLSVNFGDAVLQSATGGGVRLGAPQPAFTKVNPTMYYTVDSNWVTTPYPLAQQYAAGLANMLGANCLTDGSNGDASGTTWPGTLTYCLNAALGLGYGSNVVQNHGDNWTVPGVPPAFQVGPPASWRQMHANIGFPGYSGKSSLALSNEREVSVLCLGLTPFGGGLVKTEVPDRNLGDVLDVADIDCPWYVNAMVMTQFTAKGMICGMDSTHQSYIYPSCPTFISVDAYNGTGYWAGVTDIRANSQSGDLLPIPPDKADPTDGSKIAKWNDGVARTGADGVEGGGLPPIVGKTEPWTDLEGVMNDYFTGVFRQIAPKNGLWNDAYGMTGYDSSWNFCVISYPAEPYNDLNGDGEYGNGHLDTILSTGYRRPATTAYGGPGHTYTWPNIDPGSGVYGCHQKYSFIMENPGLNFRDDPFFGNAALVWKNPVRDELVARGEYWDDARAYCHGYPNAHANFASLYATPARTAATANRGMSGSWTGNDMPSGYRDVTCSEDQFSRWVIGGDLECSSNFHNRPVYAGVYPAHTPMDWMDVTGYADSWGMVDDKSLELDDNTDTVDECLSYQDDIIAALCKTMVDCRLDQRHGQKINGNLGYLIIEDVETVFLGFLGIAVRYNPTDGLSHASTIGMSKDDYEIWNGAGGPVAAPTAYPAVAPAKTDWVLGGFNQLQALSKLVSSGGGGDEDSLNRNEIGYDRGHLFDPYDGSSEFQAPPTIPYHNLATGSIPVGATPALAAPIINPFGAAYPAGDIHIEGNGGQCGYRNWQSGSWPAGYQPTWAALSRVLEHRLNDVRMSLFGTPALDLNQDLIIDATTNDGTGVVNPGATIGDPDAQRHFSVTGRWYLGRNHYWRVFIKSELWNIKSSKLESEAALEDVTILDPNGDGDLSDSHNLYRRWHANPIVGGRDVPTDAGRTEAILP